MRALIIEDELAKNDEIKSILDNLNYKLDIAYSYDDALYYLNIREYNTIIYNLSTPSKNFINQTKNIKKTKPDTFITVIENSDNYKIEIEAYNNLVDYFIVNPINMEVLKAKLSSVITNINSIDTNILNIDTNNEVIIFKNKFKIDIKGKTFLIFEYLVKNSDKVVSKEELLNGLWGDPELVTPNVIEVSINKIRSEFKKYIDKQVIKTVRKKGYKFIL